MPEGYTTPMRNAEENRRIMEQGTEDEKRDVVKQTIDSMKGSKLSKNELIALLLSVLGIETVAFVGGTLGAVNDKKYEDFRKETYGDTTFQRDVENGVLLGQKLVDTKTVDVRERGDHLEVEFTMKAATQENSSAIQVNLEAIKNPNRHINISIGIFDPKGAVELIHNPDFGTAAKKMTATYLTQSPELGVVVAEKSFLESYIAKKNPIRDFSPKQMGATLLGGTLMDTYGTDNGPSVTVLFNELVKSGQDVLGYEFTTARGWYEGKTPDGKGYTLHQVTNVPPDESAWQRVGK